ncbi:MAG: ParA family protein [Armatimonadota bacterium]|nr:ParA family protein [Armatimonadota bacterium]MDR5702026.1 ParA family protein [Armatimonadota bacterium]MDR7434676.1 ParA family protein [Armatimonadota bacterium]
MGIVLTIVNQKGGVGKSTTAVNLGACLAERSHRILLIDMDPQANATSGVGVRKRDVVVSMYDVLIRGEPMEGVILPTPVMNLDLAPASIHLAGAEVELVTAPGREGRLRAALSPLREKYDLLLVDCPPSLGLLTVNALVAADETIIPIQCEYYALEGLSQLVDSIALVRRHLNPNLRIGGVLLTMYDARTNLSQQVVDEVRRYFKEKVFETVIPRSVRLAEAPSYGQPIILYDSSCRGAEAYRNLAKEVESRAGLLTRVP